LREIVTLYRLKKVSDVSKNRGAFILVSSSPRRVLQSTPLFYLLSGQWTASLQILLSSLFTYHPSVRHFTFYIVKSILKWNK